ncbi:DUF3135 domain-containing protein [Teredinibacter franksiae]|uniref:DUF3135 domain-containing protein n=1 Tax=Teredinibacter franksiae TaxID=2761453 RepID=UPI001624E42F|nr:DUF3135 domain-containing protein [Teredinibacter franksiae]
MNKRPNFDQLIRLAEHQPEALEAFRKREIEALIDSAPESYQRRLRGLQFQVDAQRQIHKTPMGACVAISKMMHDSLNQLNHYLNAERNHSAADATQVKALNEAARVIPFSPVG